MSRSPREPRSAEVFAVDGEGLIGALVAGGEVKPLDLGALAQEGAGSTATTVDVIAGNDIAVHWVQQPPDSVRSLTELRQVAHARCAQLHGGALGDWRVAADWQVRRPFVCAALPASTALQVEETLRGIGRAARWHSTWGIAMQVMAGNFAAEGWSALRTPARTLLWHASAGEVNAMQCWPSSPQGDGSATYEEARRQMNLARARRGEAPIGELYWHDLARAGREASLAVWLGGQRGRRA